MAVVPSWIEAHCVVPDGFRKGAPFRLYDYQLLYVANFYLVRGDVRFDARIPILGPAFVHRRGLLVGPQKVGKNPLIATQVCVEGVGPALFAGWAGSDDGYVCREHGCRCGWEYPYDLGEPMGMAWPTPLIQITAFSEESTENTYDALRPMIDDGPLADVVPRTGEEFIRLPGGGRIDTVTSSAQSRLGQRVTFVPQDEVGIWTAANKMTRVADTQYRGLSGMGGRASLTSNAWDPAENSVAQQQYESPATDIYRQFVQPPRNLSYSDKRERRRIHRVVYPPDVLREGGGHLDLDGIENEAADLVERDAPQAMRFYGNMLVAGAGAAVDPDVWDKLARLNGPPPAGTAVGLGFDGSVSKDATVLEGCTADGYSWTIQMWERPPGNAAWTVPRKEVDEAVERAFATWRVGRMLADPPWWQTEIGTWQELYGTDAAGDLIVQPFQTNQWSKWALVVDRWLTAIAEGTYTHDGDPAAGAHVKAAHLRKVRVADSDDDRRTKYVLVKGGDGRKIDAAVAKTLAHEAAVTMLVDEPVAAFFSL